MTYLEGVGRPWAHVSYLKKAEVAFMASAATSSTGLLTASRRARLASPHRAEVLNSLISSGCLRSGAGGVSEPAPGATPAGPRYSKTQMPKPRPRWPSLVLNAPAWTQMPQDPDILA